jgi:uncharacterized Fe-S center protein
MTGKPSQVYFVGTRMGSKKEGLVKKFGKLIDRVGLDFVAPKSLCAIKLTVGELGNTAYLRPQYAAAVVERVKARGGKPFITDSNCLYHGSRNNAVDHLTNAYLHGFSYATVGAPVIIADGLTSRDYCEVTVNLKHFKTVKYGSVAHHADSLICLSHFKGHLAAGFGGAIKNLGMGLGSRSMKQRMHASVRPEFTKIVKCTGCGECFRVCEFDAIRIVEKKARFDYEKCSGCGECIVTCPEGCLKILWNESPAGVGEKMVETCAAILKKKKDRALFFNFLIDITPDCDCFPWNDHPFAPNIGILASTDPIAIDQASADLVTEAGVLPASDLDGKAGKGQDKFRALRPNVDWTIHLKYGEEIGLGSTRYERIDIES